MLLSCKQVARLVSQGLDRDLGFTERVRLRVHLAVCNGCTNFQEQLRIIRESTARLADHRPES
jgi:Putative zinc-finger